MSPIEYVPALLLEKSRQMPWYTNMGLVFQAFKGLQKNYDWMITDLNCGLPQDAFRNWNEPIIVSGQDLSEVVDKFPDAQWSWAVLSGFPAGAKINVDSAHLPYADGNPGFWVESPQIQHPDALIELVCWDSGSTILLSRIPEVFNRFREYFSDAIDLAAYNIRSNQAAT